MIEMYVKQWNVDIKRIKTNLKEKSTKISKIIKHLMENK